MAITFDAQSASAYSGASSTSVTWSHTCTGSNLILIVGVYATADNLTGVTYNGVAMTFINKLLMTGGAAGQEIYLYYLINPATGANNVVATASTALLGYAAATSYAGVRQTGQPEAQNTNVTSTTTSLSTAVTTITDNSWLVGWGYSGGSGVAGANTTLRSAPVAGVIFMMDSNAAQTPPGSFSLTFTQPSGFAGACVASIAPFGAAPPASTNQGFFNLY